MSLQQLRVRRAIVDDLDALKSLWASMRLSPAELERRLTEFQIVEDQDGNVLGAIGVQFSRQHALLHSEGYSDFGVADPARQLFWERIQKLASNLGVFRLWTQERSPFWKSFGFQPPAEDLLARLPAEWKNEFDGGWLTFQIKNEDAINAALEKQLGGFVTTEKEKTARISEKTRVINAIITIAGFGIFFICVAILVYWFMHRSIVLP